MSELAARRSMVGAPPTGSKSFFKGNPPKRDSTQGGAEEDEDGESVKSNSSQVEENENDQSTMDLTADAMDTTTNTDVPPADTSKTAAEPVKRRRRKRRIRLTDHALKVKKRGDKRSEKKETGGDDDGKENGESSLKKGKDVDEQIEEKVELTSYSPFQLLCDYILRKLIAKDPEEFFVHPVSPSMAPDYLTIIKQPMDFTTIRIKIERNEYKHIDEFHADINLIWENAMTYNQQNTVYYLAAQKLSALVKYYTSEQFLEYVRYSVPFGKNIDTKDIGLACHTTSNTRQPQTEARDCTKNNVIADDLNTQQIMESSDGLLKNRLTSRVPSCGIGYLDNRDGALALNILVGPTSDKPRLTLADVVKPLEKGNPGLLNLVEPRLCLDYPISYTDPGPYSSFAPQFDSTWATLNKHDSELLLSCYGDKQNIADALALRQMVENCDSDYLKYVDDLLDSLTDGEHSKTIKQLEDSERPQNLDKLSKELLGENELLNILDDIQSLRNLGLDLSFIDDLKIDMGLIKKQSAHININEKFKRTDVMLNDLATLNYSRLSAQPQVTVTDVTSPSAPEIQLAEGITAQLNSEIKAMNVKPAEVVSSKSIHHSLGLADDDEDFDVLREFMAFET